MRNLISIVIVFVTGVSQVNGSIPIDSIHWNVQARNHRFEHYKGKDAVFIDKGLATLRDSTFINGTIEFDIFLTEVQAFPGIRFRAEDGDKMESFFLRPHLSGKPDANQAAPVIGGLTAWQLYFGQAYSFQYSYNFDDWTHIKIVVNNQQAQVYMDYAEKPNLSWNLKHDPFDGKIGIGGSFAPMYYANFSMDKSNHEIVDFNVIEKEVIPNLIQEWSISDMFNEADLANPDSIQYVIQNRTWDGVVTVEETNAANISTVKTLYGSEGNTVFAKIEVISEKKQIKHFEFGYSDRCVVVFNGQPLYFGNNKWRSRDYRYLGTVGLFDGVFLDLKKGKNTILIAISEDFGGWAVTGKFSDQDGIEIVKITK